MGTAPPIPATLTIFGRVYDVAVLDPHPDVATRAFRLSYIHRKKATRTKAAVTEYVEYDIHESTEGHIECECWDFWARRAGTDEPCKHIEALVKAGLL
jgi:hypothetical protein